MYIHTYTTTKQSQTHHQAIHISQEISLKHTVIHVITPHHKAAHCHKINRYKPSILLYSSEARNGRKACEVSEEFEKVCNVSNEFEKYSFIARAVQGLQGGRWVDAASVKVCQKEMERVGGVCGGETRMCCEVLAGIINPLFRQIYICKYR